MDRKGTNKPKRICGNCNGRQGRPNWISDETNKREVVLKGTWCSWQCYNEAFDQAWTDAGNGFPLELAEE